MSDANSAAYPDVPSRADFPAVERRILDYWSEQGTFEKSVENRPTEADGGSEYVFNDGPPFANGLPHYGHLLTGYVKDVVPRYQTMRGQRVERVFGWDTHGLPAEMETEKELGVTAPESRSSLVGDRPRSVTVDIDVRLAFCVGVVGAPHQQRPNPVHGRSWLF